MPKDRLIARSTLLKQKKLINRLISKASREGEEADEILLMGLAGLLTTLSEYKKGEFVSFTITY